MLKYIESVSNSKELSEVGRRKEGARKFVEKLQKFWNEKLPRLSLKASLMNSKFIMCCKRLTAKMRYSKTPYLTSFFANEKWDYF